MSPEDVGQINLFFSDTNEILFETPFTAGFWLDSFQSGIALFYGSNQFLNVLTDEYFEYDITSFFEPNIRKF